ncbi:heavy-metal-associated domain-containing protein [Coprococcus sp. MSK.21.13]|nr:heavy-metal-associated domain-containing protein [Bacteroidales bacterium MSK.15.36]NSJ93123.1 heavy-metal-associated domain-containing protein [Coprococcus sp. MSK.21.13]
MKKTIKIEGMSCMHCVKHIEEALEELGCEKIEVNLQDKEAQAYFKENISNDDIRNMIKDFGYKVVSIN